MVQLSNTEARDLPSSIYQSIRNLALGKPAQGLAAAIDQDLRRDNTDAPLPGNSLVVPLAALTRTLSTNVFSAGGSLVGGDVMTIEDLLRPASVCIRAGAQVLTGLQGNVQFPKHATEPAFSWLHELDTVTPADSTLGALKLSPNRCAGQTSISSQAEVQSGGALSSFLMRSLARGLGAAVDSAAISGTGVSGQPLGLFNTTGVNGVTFGGAATLAKVLDFQTQVANADADDTAVQWIAHPNIRAKWRAIQQFTGSSNALWSLCNDTVCNRAAQVSTHCSATIGVVAGDFSKMLIGFWGADAPVSIIVDPYTASMTGRINFTASILADVGLLRPTVFCKANDVATV